MSRPLIAVAAVLSLGGLITAASDKDVPETLNFTMKSIDGKDVKLADYQGKVILVVNVASRCGYTPQYKGLEALYEKYKDQGLVVLGFPCNQFGGQEPGNESQIQEFCSSKYQVTFPMFAKIDVNGEGASPFYKTLKSKAPTSEDIKWNFEKFLIAKDGKVVGRYKSKVAPDAKELVSTLEAELKK
jgi:glutathione peroxidase